MSQNQTPASMPAASKPSETARNPLSASHPLATNKEPITNVPPEAAAPSTPLLHLSTNPLCPVGRRRNGKVARLPARVRLLVNLMLRDGAPYSDITKKLAGHGHTLNPDNLSRWHSGGYQDWLREQSLLDDQRARLDFAAKVVGNKDSQLIQEASLQIAILRMYNFLLDFDPAALKERIADNPGAYARILNALCKLSSGTTSLQRLRLAQADA